MKVWNRLFGGRNEKLSSTVLTSIPVAAGQMGELGQTAEALRDRLTVLTSRLEDLAGLPSALSDIAKPLDEVLRDHAQSHIRLVETEALLARERDQHAGLRLQHDEVSEAAARTWNDFALAQQRLTSMESNLQARSEEFAKLREEATEKTRLVDDWERQANTEGSRSHALAEEVSVLKGECEVLDRARAKLERQAADLKDSLTAAEDEALRLSRRTADQDVQVNGLTASLADLQGQLNAERERATDLVVKLDAEVIARRKAEAASQAEKARHQNELSSLLSRHDILEARNISTERILALAKLQITERADTLVVADRTIKTLQSEQSNSERRFQDLQNEADRLRGQTADEQKVMMDLRLRNDMLSNAIAMKASLLDTAHSKLETYAARIEQLTRQHEIDRSSLESENRHLVERLQSERSEREIAQGALDSSRASRASLLTQLTALKRKASDPAVIEIAADASGLGETATPNNVAFLRNAPTKQ